MFKRELGKKGGVWLLVEESRVQGLKVVLLDEHELKCVSLVVSGALHALVKPWQSDQTRSLGLGGVFINECHHKVPDQVFVAEGFDNFVLHFFQNCKALGIVETANNAESEGRVLFEAQRVGKLVEKHLIELEIVSLVDPRCSEHPLLKSDLLVVDVDHHDVREGAHQILVSHL